MCSRVQTVDGASQDLTHCTESAPRSNGTAQGSAVAENFDISTVGAEVSFSGTLIIRIPYSPHA